MTHRCAIKVDICRDQLASHYFSGVGLLANIVERVVLPEEHRNHDILSID